MASEARARANVPRRVGKQTTSDMDSYHRYVAESTTLPPPQGDIIARPYTSHSRSFSTPRPSILALSSSSSNSDVEPPRALPVPEITISSPGKPPRASPRYSLTPRQATFPPTNSQRLAVPGVRPPPPAQQIPPAQRIQRVQPRPLAPTPPTTADSDDLRKQDGLVDVALPYRPFYLQRRVLSSFAVLFAGLIVTVEAVLDLSNKRGGLGSPDHGFRYLWQYGSAFIFTCIAALWARPEHQAKASAPWLRMAKGPASVDRTLMLDYVFMFEPWTIAKATKNRDWLVAATASVGLTLKIMIVIAVALVSPTFQIVTARGVSLNLHNTFVNDPTGLQNAGALPFFTMTALQTKGLNFPDGTSKEFAFQSFSADLPATAELSTNVDGFESEIECEPAQFTLTGVQFIQASDVQLNATVSTPNCSLRQTIPNMALVGFTLPTFFMAFQAGMCGNSPFPNDGRVVVMTGAIQINESSVPTGSDVFNVPISGAVSRSAALICRPSYVLTRVQVTKNNTQLIKIERNRSAANKTLDKVHPWDVVQGHFNSYPTDSQILAAIPNINSRYPGVAIVASDAVMNSAVAMQIKDNGVPPIETFLKTDNLTKISTAYWKQYTALVARSSMMGETQEKSTGTAVIIGERLNVRQIPAHLLSGLLGFVLVLVLVAVALAPAKGFLPRDPNTIINMATLLAHSRQLLQCLRGTGAADTSTVREKLLGTNYYTGVEPYEKAEKAARGYFKIFGGAPPPQNQPPKFVRNADWRHPLPLHPWARLAAVVTMIGMIVALEVILRFSNSHAGIATTKANTDRHFLWTTGTGVIFGLVVLYLAAADCATRCLAPYAKLKEGGSFETTVDLDFMDKSKHRILYDAVKTRNIAVAFTTTALLVASLLATFSGALYSTTPIPSTRPVTLQTLDSFVNASSPCPTCTTDTLLASLILDANLTFPSFTFEDLNFNSLQLSQPLDMKDGAGTIIANVPALRSRLDCRLYPQSEINTNFTIPDIPNQFSQDMKVNIAGEPCLDPSIRSNAVLPPGISPSSVFGVATPRSAASSQCSDFTYVWGQISDTTPMQVGYISAMGCNETLETVTAKIRLTGASLHVDTTYPPAVLENTAKPIKLRLLPLQYGLLANLTTGNQLDPFFSSLVTSRFAVPAGNLGDPGLGKSGLVADAIVRQHGILRAQNLNVNSRRSLPDVTSQQIIPAMLESTSVTSLRRLVQDNASTRIIQSVLSLLVALTLVAWLLTPGTDTILPRNPCSIASVAALLADGNMFGFLGRGAEWQGTEEMKRSFLDGSHSMGFKIGCERVRKRRGAEDVNGVRAEEDMAYGINVKRGGGWGGGEDVGLGILARVNRAQRGFVRGWGKM
ncbi:hypothetical protein CORC01_01677 [Colletotrichum orchidophilum]|uniref:Uncharacterized protein n=1 Tax=Colletotrichum orchidophilum TaxID=1209926 RepID=A0A1G4BN85_9PEZI|nr:uncharacterized protein CORC01_01677 [Colletotrichum orchidophilum]OHF02919.1 hypothetical protein CORC01_01677 [Colletotrichum orchidophilum]